MGEITEQLNSQGECCFKNQPWQNNIYTDRETGRIQVENDPGRQNIICLDDKL